MASLLVQLSCVFKRRYLHLIRSYQIPLAMFIMSLLFTILTGIISIIIFAQVNETKSVDLGFDAISFGVKIGLMVVGGSNESIIYALGNVTNKTIVQYTNLTEMKEDIYNEGSNFSTCLVINATSYAYTAYYDQSVYEKEEYQAKIAAGVSNIIEYANTSGNLTQISYEPLSAGYSAALLWSYFGPILMSFALILVAIQYPTLIVEDKETYRLYTMQAFGLSSVCYWMSYFLFDLLTYELTVIIDWLILFAFRTDAIIENHFSCTLVSFIVLPIQVLPMLYGISIFFQTRTSASTVLLYVIMIVALVPYFVVTLLLKNEIPDSVSIGVSIIPSFAIQRLLIYSAEHAVGKPVTASEAWSGVYLWIWIVMILSSLLYIGIGLIGYYVIKAVGKRKPKNIIGEKRELDEDVKQIERQVLNGEHDYDAICIKHVDKVYRNSNGEAFLANNDVTMYVKDGETYGVLGANGAGKSTLMGVMTGRIQATSGSISIYGTQVLKARDAQSYISICPQFDTHLFPDMTIVEHFEMYGALKGYTADVRQKETGEYVNVMGLENHKDKLIKFLSGGNTRKLAISLAFLSDAPIVFLDEPTASLDPISRIQCQELVVAKSPGKTILLCTHLLSEAEKLCDRICIMLQGQIHAVGTHQHLSEKYGKSWKVELGLHEDTKEIRASVHQFMEKNFPGCNLVSERYNSATYNIPNNSMQVSEAFVILSTYQNTDAGYTFFTCSMSTLERVFIEMTMNE